MEHITSGRGEKFLQRYKKWKRWQKIVSVMACIVVFCTTYALILPAITMTNQTQVLECGLEVHKHTKDCYDKDKNLICGEADYVVHEHDEKCNDEEGKLVCTLPEVKSHKHTSDCYKNEKTLVCTEKESIGHQHDDKCYSKVKGDLTCTDEDAEHTHTDECYKWEEKLTCGMKDGEGGHSHSAGCYQEEQIVTCGKLELHEHDKQKCYDNGKLTCEETVLLEHKHEDACFKTVDIEEPEEKDAEVNEEKTVAKEDVSEEQKETVTEETSKDQEEVATEENEENTKFDEDDLPEGSVLPQVETSSSKKVNAGVNLLAEGDETAPNLAKTAPINVSGYIVAQDNSGNKTQLKYKGKDDTEWTVVGNDTTIPGDATLHLDVVYAGVNIEQLIAAGGQLIYDVPEFMRNPVAQGAIMDGNTQVGTIEVQNGKAVITFNQSFLTEQKENGQTLLGGTFYIESTVDISNVTEENPEHLVIGGVTIDLNWEDELIAKYGDVEIEKADAVYSEDEEGHPYLTYTLTVTAGADGCPNIKVVDKYSESSRPTQNVEEYVGVTGTKQNITAVSDVTETGAPDGKGGSVYLGTVTTADNKTTITEAGTGAAKPGTMIWDIGNMEPNEVRTLTYKVKLKDTYIGVQKKENLLNAANVYSGEYPKDSDQTTFAPKAGMNERKSSAEPVKNADGTYTIKYTVWVKANNDNTYTLTNVKIVDSLNHPNNRTEDKYLDTLEYDPDSFVLHNGGNENAPAMNSAKDSPVFNEDSKGFTYYVGDMAPGEERTLTYEITVSPEFFIEAGNDTGMIHNRALIYLDDTREDVQSGHIQAFSHNREMVRKQWDRKLNGIRVGTQTDVTMSDAIYEIQNGKPAKTGENGSFTVPADAYAYQVYVNEAGDWDVSSASMVDTLGNQSMKFIGYVKVDAFEISDTIPHAGKNPTNAEVESYYDGITPAKTAWVKIDDLKSFEFKPSEIGLEGQYAYRLTYYAMPFYPENWDGTPFIVTNQFGLSGEVGVGGQKYILTGIVAEGDAVITTVSEMHAEKLGWYYDADSNKENHQNGALYWVIKIDADTLKQGTMLIDQTKDSNSASNPAQKDRHRTYDNATVGIYEGNFGMGAITDYENIEAALASGKLTQSSAPIEIYWAEQVNRAFGSGEIYVTKDYTVPSGKSIYLVYTSTPDQKPTDKTQVYRFQNSLFINDGTQESQNTPESVAEINVSGNGGIAKQAGSVYTVKDDGSFTRDIAGGVTGTGGHFSTQDIKDTHNGKSVPGTYVDWTIHVNTDGSLDGQTVDITDFIPEGMELSFMRTFTVHDGNRAYTVENENLSAEGWTKHQLTAYCAGISDRNMKNIFYSKDQQAKWTVQNLKGEIVFQIACRVTDPDVLLGNEEKTFTNNVQLDTEDGSFIDKDSADITLTKRTMTKQGASNAASNGGRYPFVIYVNSLGEDLVQGSDKITVVDEMSESLKLEVSSIVIKNTKTDEVLPSDQYTIATEGQTLKITIPDNLPLEIKYDAIVQAAPGQAVTISNNAHWEGYEPGTQSSVEVKDFSYSAGGTVSTSDTPYLKIEKRNQYNASEMLQGAKFKVTEVELSNGNFVEKTNGQVWDDLVTGNAGTITVGREAGNLMKWNTIYKVEEVEAPDGYVLDEAARTPHYFVVAKEENGTYPAVLETYKAAGATIYYQNAEYTYTAYNHKYQATVEKKFKDANGRDQSKLDGAYHFAIYQVEGDNERFIEKQTLNIGQGTDNTSVTFNNLEGDKTYRIYELDDHNNPVQNNGLATIDSKLFDVSYNNGNNVNFENSDNRTVIVTNAVHSTELPQTGGIGTTLFYLFGGLFTVFAGVMLITRRRLG